MSSARNAISLQQVGRTILNMDIAWFTWTMLRFFFLGGRGETLSFFFRTPYTVPILTLFMKCCLC